MVFYKKKKCCKISMDDIKTKFLDLLKQDKNVKIPAMGFSEYFIQNVSESPVPAEKPTQRDNDEILQKLSDQEVLEGIEDKYFEENCDIGAHVVKQVCDEGLTCENIEKSLEKLKMQQKVVSKKVLHNILEQRGACNEEFQNIGQVEKELQEALWMCRKARSYLSYAKEHLTTKNLQILSAYRRKENLTNLLKILNSIKVMKTTDVELQKLLSNGDYSGAISLLLECKSLAADFTEYKSVQSLNEKLQETLDMTEVQLDTVLNEMTQNFDAKKYGKLQEAYKLLDKSLIAMDQLHINFITRIHSTVNGVLRTYIEEVEEKQKLLFEQLCDAISADKYISCLINLCKSCWTILASYYQIILWHQNYKLFQPDTSDDSQDKYIQEKLKKGQFRIWSDIQSKLCIYLSSSKLKTLKYEQFIQVLSITQRLKKVGMEFCGEPSNKLIEKMQFQSVEFFERYHLSCLEEICLFLDNESWALVDSFSNILQLQEFRSIKHSLHRQRSPPIEVKVAILPSTSSTPENLCDVVSVHSQDGSSIYGSCGYFQRFSEKSSPFDGGLDAAMLEEDILSGIVDEASCYFSEESEDDEKKSTDPFKSDEIDETAVPVLANNTSLNVLRCIGKYLQMCKLLHSISPQIVASMLELIDFYMYAVLEIFGQDSPVPVQSLYSDKLQSKMRQVAENVIPKVKGWPLNFSSLMNNELCSPDTLYGLSQRVVAAESGLRMIQQFELLRPYLEHILPTNQKQIIFDYFELTDFAKDIGRPVYTCVTAKVIDLQGVLAAMSKVKWDVNHVNVQHSGYIDTINRSIQTFAMRLEEISKIVTIPAEAVWNSLAHVATHLLVEGFSTAKKCSPGGRALMQLDFTHFMSILELISGLKFPEHRAYVDAYVKAFYFPIELLEDWLQQPKTRKDYSVKQLSNLISCICSSDKKTKQKLLTLIENLSDTS